MTAAAPAARSSSSVWAVATPITRMDAGRAGATPSSSSSARHASRWCAPESISTPSMSKITPRVVSTTRPVADDPLAQTVERREGPEGLERGGAILRLAPARGLVAAGGAPDHELPVARPRELVGELADPLGREVGEQR